MAYDAATSTDVLFNRLGQTWTWNGTAWTQWIPPTQTPPVPVPPGRSEAAMAYDETNKVVVLFGGIDYASAAVYADTWTWDGSGWTKRADWSSTSPAATPLARRAASMAWMPGGTGQVVLFGGLIWPLEYANDTWTWNGSTWTLVGTPPGNRSLPTPRAAASLATDRATNSVVLFGGAVQTSQSVSQTTLSDTWVFNGSWTQVAGGAPPPARSGAAMAWSATAQKVVMFGGGCCGSPPTTQLSDAWTWSDSPGVWTQQYEPSGPGGRAFAASAADPGGNLLVFGGYGGSNDTWTLSVASGSSGGFVTRCGIHFCLDGAPISFIGANEYLTPYETDQEALHDLTVAAQSGFHFVQMPLDYMTGGPGLPVVSAEYGGPVGLQYWSPTCVNSYDISCQTFNDGPSGFGHIDWILYQAAKLGIHVGFFFTQNSNMEDGGVDQYVCWARCTPADQPCSAEVGEANNVPVQAGSVSTTLHYCALSSTQPCGSQSTNFACPVGYHDEFYDNPSNPGVLTMEERFYQAYVAHVLNRVNQYTGTAYKNDPTIWSWDLNHEASCGSPDPFNYPTRSDCYSAAVVKWADTMSGYVRGIDSNHLITVGTEGDECSAPDPGQHTAGVCSTDTAHIAALPNVDYYAYEIYPSCQPSQCTNAPSDHVHWISASVAAAHSLTTAGGALVQKPTLMAEFGHNGGPTDAVRASDFQRMSQAFVNRAADGGAFWVLSPTPRLATGWELYCGLGDTSCTALSSQEALMASHHVPFTSVADPLIDWSGTTSHSADLTINADHSTDWQFDGDVSRVVPASGAADSVVWNLGGMRSAWVSTHQDPCQGQTDPTFFGSPDGVTWTATNPAVDALGPLFLGSSCPATAGAWNLVDYLLTLPAGTNYLKVVFPASADLRSPQIGEVDMWTQPKS